jgi:hypothetical protein
MFIRRYRLIAVLAVPLGFALGALLFGVMAISGNPDWRAHLTLSEVARSVGTYGLIGVTVSLCALAGGGVAVAVKDRRLQRQQNFRVLWAAIGATAGVLVLGVGTAILSSVGTSSGGWSGFIVYVSLFLAVPAAISAATLVALAERGAARELSSECP